MMSALTQNERQWSARLCSIAAGTPSGLVWQISTGLPMVLRTSFLAFKDQFGDHVRAARWTFPICIYVSVTGMVVYVLLYH